MVQQQTKHGAEIGGAIGALIGAIVALPTGEIGDIVTVPAGIIAGASAGAVLGDDLEVVLNEVKHLFGISTEEVNKNLVAAKLTLKEQKTTDQSLSQRIDSWIKAIDKHLGLAGQSYSKVKTESGKSYQKAAPSIRRLNAASQGDFTRGQRDITKQEEPLV